MTCRTSIAHPEDVAASQRLTDDGGMIEGAEPGPRPQTHAVRSFAALFCTDALLRSAYQVGKSPVLPVFAASLGAGDALLGLIVSVSVITGLVLKPIIGVISDHWGRRGLLLTAVALFTLAPFAYGWIATPHQLVGLRLAHGLATAILGPVSVAWIVSLRADGLGTRLGWFGVARTIGYVVGPLVGGLLLTRMDAPEIYRMVGLVSAIAFIPALSLSPPPRPAEPRERPSFGQRLRKLSEVARRVPALAIVGTFEATMYVGLYALKTFLPLHALELGLDLAWAGAMLSLQEGAHLVARPLTGMLADRWSHRGCIALGLTVIAVALALLPFTHGPLLVAASVLLIGVGQAMITPAASALVALQIGERHLGAGMGLIGSLRNAGKVVGPILGGLLIAWTSFSLGMLILALILVPCALWVSRMPIGAGASLSR